MIKCCIVLMLHIVQFVGSIAVESTWLFEFYVILGNKFLEITILTHFFVYLFIYFMFLHVSSITVLIIRRSNCINTSSGMISLCKWLLDILKYGCGPHNITCRKFLLTTNLTHFFMYLFISALYMFRASQCSSSGDRIVSIHQYVIPSSHWHRLIIPDDVLIQFDLLMMSALTLETCREMK